MKTRKILRINLLILLLTVLVGVIFFTCGFFAKLPKNVTVNGINVGGMTAAQAAQAVRESIEDDLKTKSLTIVGATKNYRFEYPEIGYKDNLQQLLKTVKKGGSYTAEVKYFLNGISEIAAAVCDSQSVLVTEPYAQFNDTGEPFTYFEGCDGLRADRLSLMADIRLSLSTDFKDVKLKFNTVKRTKNLESVKRDTKKLGSFITYFDGDNISRSHNIRLAASAINGTVLKKGEVFSFNATVGARTRERGYKSAKIIENGSFVEGVGGGVCQVSTTLYNAAVLSGLKIKEYHPHSLAVSYVPPSCDAMVSGSYFDMKFENVTGSPVFIRSRTGANFVAFDIYGRSDGASYSYSSCVTGSIPAPIEPCDDISLEKSGRDGIISEGYLTITRYGIQKRVLMRRDKYAPVKRVVFGGSADAEDEQENEQDG